MKKIWSDKAREDNLYWQTQDKKTLKRVNQLVKDIERNNFEGIGKPEALKGNLSGFWSRRIDDGNRLIYRINGEFIDILSCNGHYENSQKKFPIRTDWEFFAKAIFVRIKLLRRVPEPS